MPAKAARGAKAKPPGSSKGRTGRRRQEEEGKPEGGRGAGEGKEGAATTLATTAAPASSALLVREAWAPHFRRLAAESPRGAAAAAADGDLAVLLDDALEDAEGALLRAGVGSLRIHGGEGGGGGEEGASASPPPTSARDAASEALRHFLDCAVASSSSSDDDEDAESAAAVRVFRLIAGLAAATGAARPVVDRAVELSGTLLDRVRAGALLFLKQVVVAVTSPRLQQLRQSRSFLPPCDAAASEDDKNAVLDAISEALTLACTDKSKLVRRSAVGACGALLALDTAEADVLQSVVWVSQHDPAPANRAAGVRALPVRAETAEVVVARVRDVSPLVRVAALGRLSTSLGALDPELCAAIVQSGYTERCPETRQATADLVAAWLASVDGNPAKLLEALNVTFYEKQCETAVRILLDLSAEDRASDFSSRLLECLSGLWTTDPRRDAGDKLSIEALFLARVVSKERPILLDPLDWDVPQVTTVLERTVDRLRSQILQDEDGDKDVASIEHTGFVCQQLVLLASALAAAEAGAERHLRGVLARLLSDPSTPDALIDAAVRALFAPVAARDEGGGGANGERGAASARRADETTEVVVQCIRTLQGLRERGGAAGAAEYYEIRILSIWTVLLEHVPALTPEVDKLVRDGLEPVLLAALPGPAGAGDAGPDERAYAELVREAAVSCLGKLGLLLLVARGPAGPATAGAADRDRVRGYRRRLADAAGDPSCKAEIRAQAMLALADWAVAASPDEDQDDDAPLQELDNLLLSWLDQDDPFLMCVAGEVAVKLLFARKNLPSSKVLLARLVLFSLDGTFADGDIQSDADCDIGSPVRLQQLASYFFPAYASTGQGRSALAACLPPALGRAAAKKAPRVVAYVCDAARRGLAADPAARSEQDACAVDVVSAEAAIELASYAAEREHGGSSLLALCKALGSLPLLKDGGPLPPSPPALPRSVRRLLVSLRAGLDELAMAVDSPRALKELEHLQSTLDALSAGSPDDDSASSRRDDDDDDDEEEASAPSSEESAEDVGEGEDAESILSGEPRGGRDAGDLAAAFGATEFFGDKENRRGLRGGAGASRSGKKSGRKSSLESLLASPDDTSALFREEDAGRSGSSGAGKKRSESVLGRSSDASRSSSEGRRLSSLASGSQASAPSVSGGKPRSKASASSLLGMFGGGGEKEGAGGGDDADGDEPTGSSRRPSARSRAKGPS